MVTVAVPIPRPEPERKPGNVAYTRLAYSEALAESLISETDPARMRDTLTDIISNGETILTQAGDSTNPQLFGKTHISIAAAQAELAMVEDSGMKRARLIQDSLNHCDITMAVALASETTYIPAELIQSVMLVLARMLRTAKDDERLAVINRLSTCRQELPTIFKKQLEDMHSGVESLQESQRLLILAGMENSQKRTGMLQHAMQNAQDAKRKLETTGQFTVAKQADECLIRIKAAQEHPAPRPASSQPTPGQPTMLANLKPQMKRYVLTFATGTLVSLALPLILGTTDPLVLLGTGFAVTLLVGLGMTYLIHPKSAPTLTEASFCVKCGNRITPEEHFCRKCGTPKKTFSIT